MEKYVWRVGTSAEIADMWGVSTKAVSMAVYRGRLEARMSANVLIIAFEDAETYFGRPANYYPSPESKDSDN